MRLIDADKLKDEFIGEQELWHYTGIRAWIDSAPTVEAVPLREVFRVIAGHSNYHGDNILSALTCIAEGKDVKPVRPLETPTVDGVEVVRCSDCIYYQQIGKTMLCEWWDFSITKENDYCSYGERE